MFFFTFPASLTFRSKSHSYFPQIFYDFPATLKQSLKRFLFSLPLLKKHKNCETSFIYKLLIIRHEKTLVCLFTLLLSVMIIFVLYRRWVEKICRTHSRWSKTCSVFRENLMFDDGESNKKRILWRRKFKLVLGKALK